jgi:hypothetical protein
MAAQCIEERDIENKRSMPLLSTNNLRRELRPREIFYLESL